MRAQKIAFAVSFAVALLAPQQTLATYCPIRGAFEEGKIAGHWVGVFLDFDGMPGGPRAATVYTTTLRPGGGTVVTELAVVRSRGEGGAELRAMFANDKLYIINNRYAPGSSDKQYTYFAVQRFGMQLGQLVPQGEGVLNLSLLPIENRSPTDVDCTDVSGFDGSLRKAIESGWLERLWIPDAHPTTP